MLYEVITRRTSVATVLLLDMSRSMPLRGHWLPAKRMALALHTLISTQFPEDHLAWISKVAFSPDGTLLASRITSYNVCYTKLLRHMSGS